MPDVDPTPRASRRTRWSADLVAALLGAIIVWQVRPFVRPGAGAASPQECLSRLMACMAANDAGCVADLSTARGAYALLGWRIVPLRQIGATRDGPWLPVWRNTDLPKLRAAYAVFFVDWRWVPMGDSAWVATVDGDLPIRMPFVRRDGRWYYDGVAR